MPSLIRKSSISESGSDVVNRFSLVQGGLIYRLQVAIGMAMPDRSGVARRAFLTILVTWVPLLLLSLFEGRALNPQIPISFLKDYSVTIRFLIALPLLIIAEAIIDPKLNRAVKHFAQSGLVGVEQLPAFERVILETNRLRDSFVPATLILLAAFMPSIWHNGVESLRNGVLTWHTISSPAGERLSLAGWWFGVISLPLFRVLLFRWVWMILLWAVFLRKVSKLDLGCIATHPDTCGGLGFLAEAELLFGIIGFSGSAVLAGSFGNSIAYEGATVSSLKFLIAASCVLPVVMLAAPLLILTPKLMGTKRRGLYDYGALGTSYARAFDAKWVAGPRPERETLLGTADIQSLSDLDNSFAVIRQMRIVLVDKRMVMGLAVPALLPMIPLVIFATPTDQVVRAVLKLLV